MTLKEVATLLGADGVDWVIDDLRLNRPFIADWRKGYDDSFDRLAFKSIVLLERWLLTT
ncbi:MAG: hypothetical protein WAK55_04700 [Xanthobacteraceae bacterium]